MVFRHLSAVLFMAIACTIIGPIINPVAADDLIYNVDTNFRLYKKCLYNLCNKAVHDVQQRPKKLSRVETKWTTEIDHTHECVASAYSTQLQSSEYIDMTSARWAIFDAVYDGVCNHNGTQWTHPSADDAATIPGYDEDLISGKIDNRQVFFKFIVNGKSGS